MLRALRGSERLARFAAGVYNSTRRRKFNPLLSSTHEQIVIVSPIRYSLDSVEAPSAALENYVTAERRMAEPNR